MAKFGYDEAVVVIIGSGAGGGTLANELCQKGVKVVVLEAGAVQSPATFVNDEWKSFLQLAWLDNRTTSGNWRVAKDFPNLPTWICKTVGGTTTHWAGASLRLEAHEMKAKTTYGNIKDANLQDWPITLKDLEPYYAKAIIILKSCTQVQKSWATKKFTLATWRLTVCRDMIVVAACRLVFVFKAARAVRNGARFIPSFPPLRKRATSISELNRM
jgi:choline dehydrogenase-like flavoprotein